MNDEFLIGELFNDPFTNKLIQQLVLMKPGERLESERKLAEQFGLSRTALRDRLGYLESIGLLERRTGAGTYVKGLRPQALSEPLILGMMSTGMTLNSLLSVRIALERQAAFEAARVDDPVSVAFMEVAVKRMEASDDQQEMYKSDLDFHHALFIASNSTALIFFSDVLSDILMRSVQEGQKRILQLTQDRQQVRILHRSIYQAVADKNPTKAMLAIDEHFKYLEDVLLKRSVSQ